MKLTNKCKLDFQQWFCSNDNHHGLNDYQISLDKKYRMSLFNQLTPSMQYGVYVDFFDLNGIIVQASKYTGGYMYFVTTTLAAYQQFSALDRPEARSQAIIKANELYNKLS